jgi:hypothetical protein
VLYKSGFQFGLAAPQHCVSGTADFRVTITTSTANNTTIAAPLFARPSPNNARHKRRLAPTRRKMTFSSRRTPSQQEDAMPLVITRSTEVLAQTAKVCEYGLTHPTPPLEGTKHAAFLTMLGLKDILPRGFASLDASRPWMMYWVLCALKMLGDDITPHRKRSTPFCPHFVVWGTNHAGRLRV